MAKQPKDSSPHTLNGVASYVNTSYGRNTVTCGVDMLGVIPRLPSGIFVVDFNTGGGIPVYGTTCAWGQKSGGKSSLAINVARMCNDLCWRCYRMVDFCRCSEAPIRQTTYIGDVEGTLDKEWATSIQLTPDSYYHGLADYGEQHINIADYALRADDCGVVIIDSLAQLIPEAEMNAPLEDKFMGQQALLITRMVRKLKQRLIRERKRGHPCLAFFVNQLRLKMGVTFGSPETMSGGEALQHEFSLLLRCNKISLKKTSNGPDAKYYDPERQVDMAVRQNISIHKNKVPIIGNSGEYIRCIENVPELGLQKGQVDDVNTVLSVAKNYGLFFKSGSKYTVGDYEFDRVGDIRTFFIDPANFQAYVNFQQMITEAAIDKLKGA